MKHSSFYLAGMVLMGIVTAMSSCSTCSFTSRTQQVNGEGIAETKKAADVETDFTKQITMVGDWALSANAAKASAEYKAIVENKIDVLVDPIYKVTVAPVFNTTDGAPWYTVSYRAEVIGYAGTYKKMLTEQEQIEQLKDVKKEDIEKYKLLNEPDFYKYYYSAKKGDVKGNVIIGGGSAPLSGNADVQPAGLPILKDVMPQKEVKTMSEKQIHDLIVTGKFFVGFGASTLGIGVICASAGAGIRNKMEKAKTSGYYNTKQYQSAGTAIGAGCGLVGAGGFLALVVGAPCWGVGEKELKLRNGNLAFNYNISASGVNLALKF